MNARSFTSPCLAALLVLGAACSGTDTAKTEKAQLPAKTTVCVFIVRHAEAYKNLPDTSGMSKEKLDSLTPRGEEQAAAAGAYLRDKGVAAVITMEGDLCGDIKIALGAVAPTPIRAKKAEELIKGKKIDEGLIEEAGKIAAGEASPIDDVRGSAFYRTEIVNVFTKRAIRQALEQAK